MGIAAGIIEPQTKSKIHIMPFVDQVTFVLMGSLVVKMKNKSNPLPYTLELSINQAILTKRGTLSQLRNESYFPCTVLYIVNPAYLYEKSKDRVIYDDAVEFDEEWNELKKSGWILKRRLPTIKQRKEAEKRLAKKLKKNRSTFLLAIKLLFSKVIIFNKN